MLKDEIGFKPSPKMLNKIREIGEELGMSQHTASKVLIGEAIEARSKKNK